MKIPIDYLQKSCINISEKYKLVRVTALKCFMPFVEFSHHTLSTNIYYPFSVTSPWSFNYDGQTKVGCGTTSYKATDLTHLSSPA